MKVLKKISVLSLLAVATAQGFTISLNFDHDDGFFNNLTAKAAVEKAAADLSAAITTQLSALNTQTVTGNATGGSGHYITYTNTGYYTNPTTGLTESRDFSSDSLAANEYVVYVGTQTLSGSILGQGGAGFGFGGNGTQGAPQSAYDAASQLFASTFLRGGPQMFNGNITVGEVTRNLQTGLTVGNLWFDDSSSWHFDAYSAVESGKNDLYSVALHELLHAVGVGVSDPWMGTISGTDWMGAEVIALHGTGTNIIDPDEHHFANGIMSTRLDNGEAQEAVMSPALTQGTRKYLTAIDLAALRDIGFTTIPEPSSMVLLSMAALIAFRRQR